MKFFFTLLVISLMISCSNISYVKNNNIPFLVLNVKNQKYPIILKYHFNKNLSKFNKKFGEYRIDVDISFSEQDTLTNKGKNSLSILNGTINYKIYDVLQSRVSNSGQITSSINIGSVSSLYGKDQNINFTKERLTKYLASKLYNRVLLSIKKSEN